jgi:hypothetical protein
MIPVHAWIFLEGFFYGMVFTVFGASLIALRVAAAIVKAAIREATEAVKAVFHRPKIIDVGKP